MPLCAIYYNDLIKTWVGWGNLALGTPRGQFDKGKKLGATTFWAQRCAFEKLFEA